MLANQHKPSQPHILTNTKVALSSVGILHWGRYLRILGAEIADFRLMAKVFGEVVLSDVEATCATSNSPCLI